jgi:hypothetical protein
MRKLREYERVFVRFTIIGNALFQISLFRSRIGLSCY